MGPENKGGTNRSKDYFGVEGKKERIELQQVCYESIIVKATNRYIEFIKLFFIRCMV